MSFYYNFCMLKSIQLLENVSDTLNLQGAFKSWGPLIFFSGMGVDIYKNIRCVLKDIRWGCVKKIGNIQLVKHLWHCYMRTWISTFKTLSTLSDDTNVLWVLPSGVILPIFLFSLILKKKIRSHNLNAPRKLKMSKIFIKVRRIFFI